MYADALLSAITLSLAATVFYGPWQETCTDWARQIVFECRNKLFDMAYQGELSFDSSEYRDIREFFQKSIRYSHQATLPGTIVHFINARYEATSELEMSLNKIASVSTRREVYRLVARTQKAILMSILVKSMPGLIIILGAWIAAKLHVNRHKYAKLFSDRIRKDVEIAIC
jgi:hypothetical protein